MRASRQTTSHRHRRGRGYVLVLTLVMLALAAVSLQAMALRSMESALAATDASDELQRRWAMTSIQQVVLPRVPVFLQRAEQKAQAAVPSLHASITLGGQSLDLVLADEQAKLNVNVLYDRLGRDALQEMLQDNLQEMPESPVVELRPLRGSDPEQLETSLIRKLQADLAQTDQPANPAQKATDRTTPPKPAAFVSFQQLWPTASPEDLLNGGRGQDAWTARWTCWGNGQLTLRRASPQAVTLACRRVLDSLEIRKLLEIRSQAWNMPVTEVLSQMDLVAVKRARLEALFTGRSECYSIWITQHAAQRNWHRFAVRDAAQKNRVAVYEW